MGWRQISYKASLHQSLRLFKKPKNINEINNEVLSSNWKGIIYTDTLNGPGSVIRSKVLKKTGLSDPEFFWARRYGIIFEVKKIRKTCS